MSWHLILAGKIVLLAVLLIAISDAALSHGQGDATETKSLEELRNAFHEAEEALQDPIRGLQSGYEEQLSSLMAATMERGHLEQVLAVKKELAEYKQAKPVAPADGFPELKRLQGIYAEALAQRQAGIARSHAQLVTGYKSQLLTVQTELTKKGLLEEALKIKAEIDNLPVAPRVSPGKTSDATKDSPFENSLGMKFVPVPIPSGPTKGRVILFSIWETRVKDYRLFTAETGREWRETALQKGDDNPAVQVSADDGVAFCDWLTERERTAKRIGPHDRYRLPLDHEWSCAVGIGEMENPAKSPMEKSGAIDHVYPWGEQWPPPKNFGNYLGEETKDNLVAGKAPIPGFDDGFRESSPVGSFPPNALGLYDLGGNVCEWCVDSPGADGKTTFIFRDAGWRHAQQDYLVSSKRWSGGFFDHIGFRCVLELNANQN